MFANELLSPKTYSTFYSPFEIYFALVMMYESHMPKLVLVDINLQINRRALLIYYLFLAVTLKLDTFI